MTSTQAITFHPTLTTLLLSGLAICAVLTLSWLSIRRSGFRTSAWGLESIRVLLVAAAVVLLNQPEWTEEFRPSEKPTVVVLADLSYSMRTRDEIHRSSRPDAANVAIEGAPATRSELIEPLLSNDTWQILRDKFDVVVKPFSSDDPSGTSDLASPIEASIQEHVNLRAIVLASDGDWNSGGSPINPATRLRMKGIPIISVPVGSPSRLPDIELLSFDLPTFGIAGKTVSVPLTIESSLPRSTPATITLEGSDGSQQKKELVIQAMGRTSTAFAWKPTSAGNFNLTVSIPPQPDELLTDNNQRTAAIAIREERLKVLVVEGYPRWEYRYLRNALSRDPGVEVSCLLFHPGLSKVGGGNKDYISEFPNALEDLAKYDVVFLGDIGIGDNQLTIEQCRLLKGLVQQQASGLVFMPGIQGRQLSLVDSPLADLLPVVMDAGQPEGWGSRTPSHFELTELGRRSLLTRLADTPEENLAIWENLPGFQWHAPIVRAKAGSEILCVHQEATNANGRVPLMVTQPYGAGKILFMGTDGAWRWRKGVEDLYHYRFWGQVVRWMAYQRNMAEGETMRLYYSPEQPNVRQTIFFNANVVEKNGEPLAKGDVSARIVAPSGAAQTVRFASSGEEWGAFSAKFTPQEPGPHRVTLRSLTTDSSLETDVLVQGGAAERLGKPARPEVLEELARLTHGQTIRPDQVAQAIETLQQLTPPPFEIRRWHLWSHAVVAATLIGLLAAFWIGRKMAGLM